MQKYLLRLLIGCGGVSIVILKLHYIWKIKVVMESWCCNTLCPLNLGIFLLSCEKESRFRWNSSGWFINPIVQILKWKFKYEIKSIYCDIYICIYSIYMDNVLCICKYICIPSFTTRVQKQRATQAQLEFLAFSTQVVVLRYHLPSKY